MFQTLCSEVLTYLFANFVQIEIFLMLNITLVIKGGRFFQKLSFFVFISSEFQAFQRQLTFYTQHKTIASMPCKRNDCLGVHI